MSRGVRAIAIVILVGLAFQPVFVRAQSSEEAQRQALQRRLQELEQIESKLKNDLGATQQQKQTLQNEVNKIRGQISYMETKIQATGAKIELTDVEIVDIEANIGDTQKEIDERRDGISRLIALRHQQDQESLLLNLVRFENISEFFQRLQEVVSVHENLLSLVSELKGYRVALELDKTDLEGKKGDLIVLSEEQEHQQYGLIIAKSAKDKVLIQTKGQESAYQDQLSQVEREKAELFKELRELELKIVHGGLYIVHITATSIPPPGTHIFQRPSGWITQGYGMTTYARRGAYGGAAHNGVDIATGYGNPIRAIGAGRVVASGLNSGWGNWAAVQHSNNMVSVYGHMNSIAAAIGQQLTTGQILGYEGSTGNSTGAHLHLSLYRDFFTYINDKDGQLYFNYFDGSVSPCSYMAC